MKRDFEFKVIGMRRTATKEFNEIEEAAKQAARNIQDAFADFLFDPFDEGIKGMLKSFLDAIRRMIANQLATKLFGFLKGFFPGGGGGGGGKIPGFARGGRVAAGVPAVVGERGPEVFVPPVSGTIVPNNKLGGASVTIGDTYIYTNGDLNAATLIPILEENNRKQQADFLDALDRGAFA